MKLGIGGDGSSNTDGVAGNDTAICPGIATGNGGAIGCGATTGMFRATQAASSVLTGKVTSADRATGMGTTTGAGATAGSEFAAIADGAATPRAGGGSGSSADEAACTCVLKGADAGVTICAIAEIGRDEDSGSGAADTAVGVASCICGTVRMNGDCVRGESAMPATFSAGAALGEESVGVPGTVG
ncbi:MAG TPA: hypothetical protein VI386_06730 [Candidatus Sulfotelmatobacter sp.]